MADIYHINSIDFISLTQIYQCIIYETQLHVKFYNKYSSYLKVLCGDVYIYLYITSFAFEVQKCLSKAQASPRACRCWVDLSSLGMSALASSCCFLVCPVWLLPLGGLLVSEEEMEGSRSEGEGRRDGRSGGKGNCGQDASCERRINFQ